MTKDASDEPTHGPRWDGNSLFFIAVVLLIIFGVIVGFFQTAFDAADAFQRPGRGGHGSFALFIVGTMAILGAIFLVFYGATSPIEPRSDSDESASAGQRLSLMFLGAGVLLVLAGAFSSGAISFSVGEQSPSGTTSTSTTTTTMAETTTTGLETTTTLPPP